VMLAQKIAFENCESSVLAVARSFGRDGHSWGVFTRYDCHRLC
jgi:hypothetical protein